MSKLLDANLIIRYLSNDDSKKAKAVEKLLKTSKEPLILLEVTIAEIAWVLTSLYKFPKEKVVDSLQSLLMVPSIEADRRVVGRTLSLFKMYPFSFIDAYLVAYAIEKNIEGIYSYDKDIDKAEIVDRFEP